MAFLGTLGFLFVGFLFLTIGELAGGVFLFFAIGGWVSCLSLLLLPGESAPFIDAGEPLLAFRCNTTCLAKV